MDSFFGTDILFDALISLAIVIWVEFIALNLLLVSTRLDNAFTERFLTANLLPIGLLDATMGYGRLYLRIFMPPGTEATYE